MPLWATLMPLNQIDKRSRSAGSPALPTAMTTRPQLASSPAIAVFTKGELAIDMAMRRAGREGEQRIRRRGIAVDRHGIEAVENAFRQQRLQSRRRNRRIRKYKR